MAVDEQLHQEVRHPVLADLPFLLVVGATAAATLVRVSLLSLGDGFPLNDGGMFYAMIKDLERLPSLPAFTSYNGGEIPFAYPPLPLYLVAAIERATGWGALEQLRALPVAFSILTIPAFYALGRQMMSSPMAAALATSIFAALPRSFNWEIVGGGITRAPGFLFAILALRAGYLLCTRGNRRDAAYAIAFSALTVLCHLEMAWFIAFSVSLFLLWHEPTRAVKRSLGVGIGVAALTFPWWFAVLLRTGPAPFISAAQTGGFSPDALLRVFSPAFTEEPLLPVGLVLAAFGLAKLTLGRQFLIPLWLLLIIVADPRKAATVGCVPLAILAGYGIIHLGQLFRSDPRGRFGAGRLAPMICLGLALFVYMPVAAVASAEREASPLHAVRRSNLDAMSWVVANTPPEAIFIVMPSVARWGLDGTAEWFPALTQRVSASTVQGSEWLGKSEFQARIGRYETLVGCTSRDIECLELWAARGGVDFQYVYVPKGAPPVSRSPPLGTKVDCCSRLIDSLRRSPQMTEVFDNEGASIFRRVAPVR